MGDFSLLPLNACAIVVAVVLKELKRRNFVRFSEGS
jgi:hypothetical protein